MACGIKDENNDVCGETFTCGRCRAETMAMAALNENIFLKRWQEVAVKHGKLDCGHSLNSLTLVDEYGSYCKDCLLKLEEKQ